jgi:acetate kinase
MPVVAQTYALPQDVREAGVRHWGYHGISYDYISRQVPKFAPQARRVIAAHLGGGASMCAMLDGRSVETTMAFAGVTGLPMATRSGVVPQDALFYLLRRKLFDDVSREKCCTSAQDCSASRAAPTCGSWRRTRIRMQLRQSNISFRP